MSKCQLGRKIKSRKNRDGSTMIETLVAFMVVVTMVLMFSRVVTASVQMLHSTRKMIEKTETFNAEYYKTANYPNRTKAASDLKLSVVTDHPDMLIKPAAKSMNLSSSCQLQKYTNSGLSIYTIKVPEPEVGGETP